MTVTTLSTRSPSAPTEAGANYADGLTRLSDEPSRAGRAVILQVMAWNAEQLARFHFGRTTWGNPHGDTLSWQETATVLRQLAAAELGDTLVITLPLDDVDDEEDPGDWTDWNVWSKVAFAADSGEYDTAIAELLDVLTAAEIPTFTLRQIRGVALACSASRPAEFTDYPTEAAAAAAYRAARRTRAGRRQQAALPAS